MQNNGSLAMTSKKHEKCENHETQEAENNLETFEETYGKEKEADYGCFGRYPSWLQANFSFYRPKFFSDTFWYMLKSDSKSSK